MLKKKKQKQKQQQQQQQQQKNLASIFWLFSCVWISSKSYYFSTSNSFSNYFNKLINILSMFSSLFNTFINLYLWSSIKLHQRLESPIQLQYYSIMMRVYACKQLQVQISPRFHTQTLWHKQFWDFLSAFSIGSMVSGQFCFWPTVNQREDQ